MGMDEATLVASGDLRETANRLGWPAQQTLEAERRGRLRAARRARSGAPTRSTRAPATASSGSQRMGMDVFAGIDPRRAAHRGRGGLAVLPSRAGRPASPPRADPHRRQLDGHVAGPGRDAQPQRLADQGRRDVHHALERGLHRRLRRRRSREWLETGKIDARHDATSATSTPTALPAAEAELGRALAAELAARQGHHGRLRRRLHGHVQRHHPRRAAATRWACSRNGSASRRSIAEMRQVTDDEAASRAATGWTGRGMTLPTSAATRPPTDRGPDPRAVQDVHRRRAHRRRLRLRRDRHPVPAGPQGPGAGLDLVEGMLTTPTGRRCAAATAGARPVRGRSRCRTSTRSTSAPASTG